MREVALGARRNFVVMSRPPFSMVRHELRKALQDVELADIPETEEALRPVLERCRRALNTASDGDWAQLRTALRHRAKHPNARHHSDEFLTEILRVVRGHAESLDPSTLRGWIWAAEVLWAEQGGALADAAESCLIQIYPRQENEENRSRLLRPAEGASSEADLLRPTSIAAESDPTRS